MNISNIESNRINVNQVIEALNKNNFNAKYCATEETAINEVISLTPANSTVGMGGSFTVQQLGLSEILADRGCQVLDHNKPGLSPEEALELRRRQLVCDVFLTGTNAVTLDGQIVNRDGIGNRVAAMIFGPKRVIIIVGINKIVSNVDEAIKRIETIAAPMNNKRLNKANPCIKTGQCMNCQGPSRICNVTTILSKKPMLTDTHIIIVGNELGF
ncbi:lactate utilization protein [Desulforamulus aquiferis]|uniref:Lactate utilization protein n=1 Tax=Desulforamulus aquiferis TaxID=1397668 RepID=A0AAW7ZCJ5_9FIRM|nr:lactate utilization protein [Desulforamulus aquiferis]MDO7787158.1 lactate utilization protein [Desulforamulus aquiferis]RYD04851.1 hypothetical protein N752_13065 [Desulforamulus aquiferis]